MTRFMIGLLLGLLLGIAGTAAFLVTAGGADYFIATSPRVRELEAELKHSSQEGEWLKKRLSEDSDMITRLESRFSALTERFDTLSGGGSGALGSSSGSSSGASASAAAARPSSALAVAGLTTPTPTSIPAREAADARGVAAIGVDEKPTGLPRATPPGSAVGSAGRPSASAAAGSASPAARRLD